MLQLSSSLLQLCFGLVGKIQPRGLNCLQIKWIMDSDSCYKLKHAIDFKGWH